MRFKCFSSAALSPDTSPTGAGGDHSTPNRSAELEAIMRKPSSIPLSPCSEALVGKEPASPTAAEQNAEHADSSAHGSSLPSGPPTPTAGVDASSPPLTKIPSLSGADEATKAAAQGVESADSPSGSCPAASARKKPACVPLLPLNVDKKKDSQRSSPAAAKVKEVKPAVSVPAGAPSSISKFVTSPPAAGELLAS